MPDRLPPSLAEIEALAERALGTIPRQLKRQLGRVVIRVEQFPDEETEAAMGLESPFDILGLYRGVALPHKSVSDPRPDLDMIFLYRRPILDYWCESGEDLEHLVRHVLIHEIGHHFGFSDEDMERIESSDCLGGHYRPARVEIPAAEPTKAGASSLRSRRRWRIWMEQLGLAQIGPQGRGDRVPQELGVSLELIDIARPGEDRRDGWMSQWKLQRRGDERHLMAIADCFYHFDPARRSREAPADSSKCRGRRECRY